MSLSDHEIAALPDHEAVPLGLPRRIEAWLSLRVQGRIDAPDFSVELTLEPLQYAHAWSVYQREGAIVTVGAQRWRLTAQQYAIFVACDALCAAADDVAARLRTWPMLLQALDAHASGYVRVQGHIPRVVLQSVAQFPPRSMTRHHGARVPVSAAPQAAWAMGAGHRYFLRTQ